MVHARVATLLAVLVPTALVAACGAFGTTKDDELEQVRSSGNEAGAPGTGADAPAGDPGPVACIDVGACVAEAPAGWTGPFALYDGASPPTCAGLLSEPVLRANAGLVVSPNDASSCTACSCGAIDGTACGNAFAQPSGGTCAGTCNTFTTTNGTCVTLGGYKDCNTPAINATTGFLDVAPPSNAGSCKASGGVAKPSATSWKSTALGCGVKQAPLGCPRGTACLPSAPGPFETNACVFQAGDVACPGQGYTAKRLFHRGVDDTRDCAPCKCGTPTGVTCKTTATPYPDIDCGGTGATALNAPICVSGAKSYRVTIEPKSGSCAATGGAPTGAATAADPVTVCCAE